MKRLIKILIVVSISILISACGNAPTSSGGASKSSNTAGGYGNTAGDYAGKVGQLGDKTTNGYGSDYSSQGGGGDYTMIGMDSIGQGSTAGDDGMGQLASNAGGLPIDQLMPNNGGGGNDSQGSSGGRARFYPQGLLSGNIEGNKFVMSSVIDTKQQVYPSNFQLNPTGDGQYLVTIAGYDVREDRLIESSGYILFQFVMPDIRTTGTYDVIYPPSANNAKVTIVRVEDFNDRYEMLGYLDNAEFYYMESNNTYKMSVEFNIDKGLLQVKPPQK